MLQESSSSGEDEDWNHAKEPPLIQPTFLQLESRAKINQAVSSSKRFQQAQNQSSATLLSVPSGKPPAPSTQPSTAVPCSASPPTSQPSKKAGLNDSEQESDRKERLLLYVLVMRCIAYPFCAKQPTDLTVRQVKVTSEQLEQIRDQFQAFVSGGSGILSDEAFQNAVLNYHEVFLQSDLLTALVRSGGCSLRDFRDVFKNNVEKRVRCLPEIDGLSKETVLSSWMAKFDQIIRGDEDPRRGQRVSVCQNEPLPSKEMLFDMFQAILSVPKYQHQIMFNACQLDDADEQAAQIRRELETRLQMLEEAKMRSNKFSQTRSGAKLDLVYYDEAKETVIQLMSNLEAVPVNKTDNVNRHSQQAIKPLRRLGGKGREGPFSSSGYNRSNIQLIFSIEVVVCEVRNLKCVPSNRTVYCTIELEGNDKLQTDHAEASHPMWDTQADFATAQPLPLIKVKLFAESSSMISLDDKELGRVIMKPTCATAKDSEWYKMLTSKNCSDDLRIKIQLRMEKPSNVKHCGWLWVMGRTVFKKWKRRYLCLVQVSQYNFVMASFREQTSEPHEVMPLSECTVDFIYDTPPELLSATPTAVRHFFSTVRAGDYVTYATDDELDRQLWVQSIYRATGQTHKPQLPQSRTLSSPAPTSRRTGLEGFVHADPSRVDHAALFRKLQLLTLNYRLGEPCCSLGWLSPGQLFVLDEYCGRYGVRGCLRQLYYLENLLDASETRQLAIDPALLHFSFAYCASHVHGNRPDAISTVLQEEQTLFETIRQRLKQLLMRQLTQFRYYFPFGRPEGALKGTISLLERVLMKDIATPADPNEVRQVIRSCLDEAAYVNYNDVANLAKIEDTVESDLPSDQKLKCLVNLAEMCIDILQQNEEYHAEAFAWFSDLLVDHAEIFWSMFTVDMLTVLESQPPDTWDSFVLFQLLNDYLRSDANLRNGKFHRQLCETFAPQVIRYVDLMEASIAQSINRGFEQETWTSQGGGCASSADLLWKLEALQSFIADLHWPEAIFAEHLDSRLKSMSSDMLEAAVNRIATAFDAELKRASRWVDYLLPTQLCAMLNTCVEMKSKVFYLCSTSASENLHQYHSRTDKFLEDVQIHLANSLVDQLCEVLNSVLVQLARYDDRAMLAALLSIAKPIDELHKDYVNFVLANIQQLRQKIYDEMLVLSLFESWYNRQFEILQDWLARERTSALLHPNQLACLSFIIKQLRIEFELQGVARDALETRCFLTVNSRIKTEEATRSMKFDDEELMLGSGSLSNLLPKAVGNS